MMSHMASPTHLAEQAKLMEAYGAHCVNITDSGGQLAMNDVRARMRAYRGVLDPEAEIGIHHTRICHCTWPTPCCGRGRSCQGRRLPGRQGAGAGNTPIEAFIAVADLTGWKHNGHLLKLQDSADDIVRPLQHRPVQVDTETPTLGYSGVYSSFLRRAERAGVWSARCTGSWGCRSPRPHLLARITDRFSTVVHRRRHPTFGGSTSSRASARTT